ncbi:MAG: LamG domain-containing protein, partial [Thermoguttaceae bacterium]|nr:LamG domain-containing protein [Thermoguttaceae bacterium]
SSLDLELMGNATLVVGGMFGDAASFDGITNTYARTDKVIPDGAEAYTFAAWVNPGDVQSSGGKRQAILATAHPDNYTLHFELASGSNYFRRAMHNTIAGNETSETRTGHATTIRPTEGEWYHVAVTFEAQEDDEGRWGGSNKVYIDGVLALDNASSGLPSITDGFHIAANRRAGDGLWYKGLVDDTAVWSRQLSGAEIGAVAGLGKFSGTALSNTAIDDVLAMHKVGQKAAAGPDTWNYTTTFDNMPADVTRTAGLSYVGTDGNKYIILDGTQSDGFRGVTTAPYRVTDGLNAYWNFDDGGGSTAANSPLAWTWADANNQDSSWLNLELLGGAELVSDGKFGGAVSFDGESGSYARTLNRVIPDGAESYTFTAWFNPENIKETGADRQGLLATRHASNYTVHAELSTSNNNLVRHARHTEESQTGRTTSFAPTEGEWHHIALTFEYNPDDNTGVNKLYVNGIEIDALTTVGLPSPTQGFHLGTRRWANDAWYTGLIDDAAVWGRSLSGAEIGAIAGLGKFSGVDLNDSTISEVLSLDAVGQKAVAGANTWHYTTKFDDLPEGVNATAGLSYVGAYGHRNIVFDGNASDGFVGVTTNPTMYWWRFEDDPGFLHDSGPHGLHLQQHGDTGGVVQPIQTSIAGTGLPGRLLSGHDNQSAAFFDGTQGSYFSTDSNVFNVFAEPFTVEALLHWADDDNAHSIGYILSQGTDGSNQCFALAVNRTWSGMAANELYAQYRYDTSTRNEGSGIILEPGNDYYIAFSYDADMTGDDDVGAWFRVMDLATGEWYESTARARGDLNLVNQPLFVGYRGVGANQRHFSGYIDEVRISTGILPFGALLVPEPSSVVLLLSSVMVVLLWRRRR